MDPVDKNGRSPQPPPGLQWRHLELVERLALAGLALGLLVVLAVARHLTPDPRGLGTHEQLGLAPCFTAHFFRFPCPFCGMTTAFALMAHGHMRAAFLTQPAGAIGFVAAIVALVLSAVFALLGTWPPALANNRWVKRSWIPLLILLLLAWIYKIIVYLA